MSDELWEEYSKSKSLEVREQIIIKYSYLVKYVAGRISTHVGSYVEIDDLMSYGIFGLIDAIDKFDYKKGVKFETYASLRIRGEIIDNIRKLDWVPRTLRQKNKLLDQTCSEFELKNGRQPTVEEIAEIIGISVKEAEELIKKSNISMLISLDDYLEQNYENTTSSLISGYENNPEKNYENQEVKRLLTEGINSLNEKQRQVISLYYYEDLTLKEISKVMGVSESRISQIHSNCVRILKNKLGKYKSILFLK